MAYPNENETPSSGQAASRRRGILWFSFLLFVGGIALGVWATPLLLPSQEQRAVEKTFAPRARVLASVHREQASPPRNALSPRTLLPSEKGRVVTDTVLLNGGGQADSNYFSHHLHIRMAREILRRKGLPQNRMLIFSSDGENRTVDQMVARSLPWGWLWHDLPESQLLEPTKLVNTTLPGARLIPAKRAHLRRGFRALARRIKRRKKPSTVLLFVTDHGTKGRGPWGNKIELWHEQINVAELRSLLTPLGSQTRVISVMSQCYSGGFANLMYRKSWRLHGNRCGFFSTVANREAYGCFPEIAKKNRVGHAYRILRAMRWAKTYREAHRHVLLHDLTPDVPISTSDIYLEDMLRRRYRKLKGSWTRGVDRLLKRVWKKPHASLRGEIQLLRKIEKRFYLSHYKYANEVWKDIRTLRAELKQFKQLASVWEQVWKEVQRGSLMRFYRNQPNVAQAVEFELNRPDIDGQTRRLGQKLHRTYRSYLGKHKFMKTRLLRLYTRKERVQEKIHLMYSREAALLRVAKRLTRIAGMDLLRRGVSRRHLRNFRRLVACESTPVGGPPIKQTLRAEGGGKESKQPRKLPRIAKASLLPSWLGVGFQQAPAGWSRQFARMAPGAVQITDVAPQSPAAAAGLQVGDIVLAVGGRMLQLDNEIRDLVMLSPPRKPIFFLVYRNGKTQTVKVTLKPLGAATLVAQAPTRQRPPGPDDPGVHSSPGEPDSSDPHGDIYIEPDTRVYGLRRGAPQKKRSRDRKSPRGKASLTTVQGQPLTFPAKRGVSLAFFWATWCEGCKSMVPEVRQLRAKYKSRGLSIFAVTTDGPALLKPFLRKWGNRFPFRVAIDKGSSLSRRFRISTIPQLILFRPNGKVVMHIRRMGPNSMQQLEAAIQRLLR